MTDSMTDLARVRIFSTTHCGWCRRAEHLLDSNRIPFEVIDVTSDPIARAALRKESGGRRTVPVVFVDDHPIGGYEELARLLATGELDHLKAIVASNAGSGLPKV